MSKIRAILPIVLITTILGGAISYVSYQSEQMWKRTCDGEKITEKCTADDGIRYLKYIYHEAEPEKTKVVNHPAEPEVTHTVHHPAVYGTRKVAVDCIRTNITYKRGTCALSLCWDGMYSGSTGWGACNYHGGVRYTGGPWYTYQNEQYLIEAEWDEVIVDIPAKPAWSETVVVSPAKEAYYEKKVAV